MAEVIFMSSKPVELHSVSVSPAGVTRRGGVSPSRAARFRAACGPSLLVGAQRSHARLHAYAGTGPARERSGALRCLRGNCRAPTRARRMRQVEGSQRRPLVGPPAEGETGHPLVIETLQGTGA